jgi:peptidoglycan/LPS O-acetylase OafA/YrhL
MRVIATLLCDAGMVAGFAGVPKAVTRSPVGRAVEYLCLRSYTIYVVHFVVLMVVSAAVCQTMGVRSLHMCLAFVAPLIAINIVCLFFVVGEERFLHRPLRSARTAIAGVRV